MMLLSIAVVTTFLLFPRSFQRAAGPLLEAAGDFLAGVHTAARGGLAMVFGWLNSGGVATPRAIVGGLLVMGASYFVARSEYTVLRNSLQVVWPDHINSELIALSVVLVTFAVGLLMHTCESWAARLPLGLLALALISMQATLAFDRTWEIGKARLLAEAAEAASAPADDGGLSISGQTDLAVPATRETPKPLLEARTPERMPCMLASLVAFLLSLGGVVMGWGAFALAHTGLAWLVALPVLGSLALAAGVFRLAAATPPAACGAVQSLVDTWTGFCARAARFAARMLPFCWTEEGYHYHLIVGGRQFDAAQAVRAREIDLARHETARAFDEGQEERERAFLRTQQDEEFRCAAAMAEASRRLMTENHEQGGRELLDTLSGQRRDLFREACSNTLERVRRHVLESPMRAISMLFWPIEHVWRFGNEDPVSVPPALTEAVLAEVRRDETNREKENYS